MKLKVALLQIYGYGMDQIQNLIKGDKYCRKAKDAGADIVVFPEMWNIAYSMPFEGALDNPLDPLKEKERIFWKNQAIDYNSFFFKHFQNLEKDLEMAILITYLEKYEPAPRNTATLIDGKGKILFSYSKVHTCDFSLESLLTPGDEFKVSELETSKGSVKIGCMICYDREFPESARVLMLKGAEIILIPNACEMDDHRLSQLKTRAFENMVGVAMVNYPGENFGHSAAFSPICYKNGYRNNLLIEAGEEEGIYMAIFDMDEIRKYRKYETWGDAYRKPKAYGDLIRSEVDEVFKRKDSRR